MKKILPFSLYIFTAWLLASASVCQAAHLQDYAQVLSPEVSTRLEKLLAEIETKKNLYIEEVILPDREGKTLESIENTFIQRLEQNTSKVEKRVLLLIILDDQFAKLYTSGNLSSIYNAKVANDIIANVTLRMGEKRFDEMARIGIAGIYHYYQESQPKEKTNIVRNILFFLAAIIAAIAIAVMAPKKKN